MAVAVGGWQLVLAVGLVFLVGVFLGALLMGGPSNGPPP